MYVYTDGFQDQFGGSKNKKLKKNGWRDVLLKASRQPIQDQQSFLDTSLNLWMGEQPQVDDILVMGVHL